MVEEIVKTERTETYIELLDSLPTKASERIKRQIIKLSSKNKNDTNNIVIKNEEKLE